MFILNKTDYIAKMKTKPNFLTPGHPAKIATPQEDRIPDTTPPSAIGTNTICSLRIYSNSIDRLAPSGCASTACPKHARKMCHSYL